MILNRSMIAINVLSQINLQTLIKDLKAVIFYIFSPENNCPDNGR